MSYLISLNPMHFKNIAHVGSFHFHFGIWKSGLLLRVCNRPDLTELINFTFVCLLKFALTSVSSESTWKPTQLWQRFILTLQLHIVREECCQQNWKQFASVNNFLCRLLVETSSSKLESSVQTFWQYCVWKCQDNTSLETKSFSTWNQFYTIR